MIQTMPAGVPSHLLRYKDGRRSEGRTVADAARALARNYPNQPLFIGADAPYTAAQLATEAESLAYAMRARGVNPGTVVSYQLPNWHEAAVINVAAAMLGAVVMPIVPIYRDAEVGQMLRDSGSRLHFTCGTFRNFDYASMLDRLRDQLPDLRNVVFVRSRTGSEEFVSLVQSGGFAREPLPSVDPSDIKLLLYTSGTTSRAKGVLHSHETLTHCVLTMARHWNITAAEAVLMPSPITHISGYVLGLEMPLLVGSRTLLMDLWNPQEAVALIDKHEIVGTLCATPFLQELTCAAEAAGSRLQSLRFFACGGAPVPESLVRRANCVFGQSCVFRVYGASEAPMITYGFLGPQNVELAATTDGEIIDYEVRIADDRGEQVPEGTTGEILARGPAMFLGYTDPGQTAQALTQDGYFRTGDLGHLAAGGALVVTGRKKDLIIRGGENISPQEIEDVLLKHSEIAEAAVVSMPHARLGEGVCAFIVAKPGRSIDTASVTAHVAASGLARQKHPEHMKVVGALPKTASGKVRKDLLRARIREDVAAVVVGEQNAQD